MLMPETFVQKTPVNNDQKRWGSERWVFYRRNDLTPGQMHLFSAKPLFSRMRYFRVKAVIFEIIIENTGLNGFFQLPPHGLHMSPEDGDNKELFTRCRQ